MPSFGGVYSGLNVSVSAMQAERQRMEVSVSNLANVHTTRTVEGGPYQRRMVVFEEALNESQHLQSGGFNGAGVRVAEVSLDTSPPIRVYRPEHPDADKDGYVNMPAIESSNEMVDMMSASRSYEANVTAFKLARSMYQRALELGRA